MSYSACTTCKAIYHTGYYRLPGDQCNTCWTRSSHEECNRKLDENRAKLVEVRFKRKFLRLPFDSEPTDNIRKGDAVIVVQGNTKEQVYAHKFILSSRSPVFAKMFDAKMLEEETGIVLINDATLPVIRAVVKFCYDAEIYFTDEVSADDVIEVAHKYQIPVLQRICEQHLIRTLNNENLPKRLKLSKKFEATGLEVAASNYFKDNFDSAIGNVLVELCSLDLEEV